MRHGTLKRLEKNGVNDSLASVIEHVDSSQVISGGGKIDNAGVGEQQFTLESYMSGNGWYVRVGNSGGQPRTLTVEAYCLQK